jgi:phosphate/sulfate permease
MMWALIVGGVWQILASYKELNVSATHSIIGAIVGFSMTFKGRGAVVWAQEQIVCKGPLTGNNHDKSPVGSIMYWAPPGAGGGAQPLAGVYTVPVEALFDKVTGAPLTMSAATLSSMTGLNIVNGGAVPNATWPGAINPCFSKSCYGQSSAGTTFSANSGPYIVNDTAHPFGALQFTIKTAGHALECSGANCPIEPSVSLPVRPGQWYYSSVHGFCTTASNGQLPFPPYKGVLIIVLSWFFSPILTGVASAILFIISRNLVLRSVNAYKRSFMVLPPMAFLTFWVNIYFVLTKGAAKTISKDAEGWTTVKAAWISAACAAGVSFFSVLVVVPLLYRRINTIYQVREDAISAKALAMEVDADNAAAEVTGDDAAASKEGSAEQSAAVDAESGLGTSAVATESAGAKRIILLKGYLAKARDAAMHGMEVNVHEIVEEDELVAAIHANAEVFDEKAEMVFSYMQVFSAICVIFAHGAGEVGYMSGPLGAIFAVVRSGSLQSTSSPPVWTVLVGAFGLVIGLGTYGYSVTRAIGTRMAKLTPSRGFAAELSTSMVIMIAAQYGLPTSSSQCITGGIIGIALCEGKKGVNVKFLLQTFSSWIWTVVFVAMITGFFFAQGAYAPSAQMARQIGYYEESLSARANLILTNYQSMLAASGYLTDGSNKDQFARYLATTISNTAPGQFYSYQKAPAGFFPGNKAPAIQSPPAWQLVGYLDTALALVQQSVVPNTASGLNMCGGNVAGATNYDASAAGPAKFPWSQQAIAASAPLSSAALADPRGPCAATGTLSQPTSITLTKATFLGPSPYAASGVLYEDSNGVAAAGFNGTVDRLFSFAPGTASVTLDQAKNSKICQQAPCNQIFQVDPYYMG